jgi:hypothetical protein
MNKFVQCHAQEIAGVLSGFDRLRFRGTFRQLCYVNGMMSVLSVLGVLLKEFGLFAEALTKRFRAGVQALADSADRPVVHLTSAGIDKEDQVRKILKQRGIGPDGLAAVLSVIELCPSYEIHRSRERKRIELQPRKRKCLHYYIYRQDPLFGLCHVRMPSWLPLGAHIVINGREWLARQMDRERLKYLRTDNCFPG